MKGGEHMKYYDIREDIKGFPNAWCYLIWSKRGPGKTYSTLRMCIEDNKKFVFLKRTKEDVDLLCANGKRKGVSFDLSPFVPLNRDFGWDIKPMKIQKGIAGFYHSNEEGEPCGNPVGYCVALSAASDVKGFDLSECDFLIFDEFIPKAYEIVKRNEGDALLDIYMTVSRDRIKRGRGELKLVCLANATSINNPTFNILDVTDVVADMDILDTDIVYQEERKIFLHYIHMSAEDEEIEEKSGIEIAMTGTAWADMSFSGHFAYDDFSSVRHQRLKGYKPFVSYIYKKKQVYIYQKEGYFYSTYAKADKIPVFNLARENEQKRFYNEYVWDLREACIEDKMQFTHYTMYDLIINYKKIFKI